MHLRGAATKQIDEGRVEWHDGISQMYAVLFVLFLTAKPANQEKIFCFTTVCACLSVASNETRQHTTMPIIYSV